jgi:hypothetical protein
MMRPLALVVVIVGVLLAGCTGGGTAPGTAMNPPPTETATETTPERDPCTERDSRTLPEFPTTLTNESVVEFTERYVNASAWNEVHAGDRLRHASVSTELLLLNRTDAGYVVHVTVFAHVTTCEGAQGVNSFGWDYFINESLIARCITTCQLESHSQGKGSTSSRKWVWDIHWLGGSCHV